MDAHLTLIRPSGSEFGLHVAHVSRDAMLVSAPNDEGLHRQRIYTNLLLQRWPRSATTVVVMARGTPPKAFKRGALRIISLGGGPVRQLFGLWRVLRRIHRRRPIDVLSAQTAEGEGSLALIFTKLYGIRSVAQVHWDIFSNEGQRLRFGRGVIGQLRKALAFWSLRHFFALRVVGSDLAKRLVTDKIHSRVSLLPVPVWRQPGDDTYRAPPTVPRVLYVGRFAEQKNLLTWLQVAARVLRDVPEAQFDLVGDGELRARLEEAAKELGVDHAITFHGWIENAALSAFYHSASTLLLTSVYEGFGRVLVEAYRHGIPCVASRIAGPVDIIEDGVSGFLHEPDNVEGFAASVIRFLREPQLRSEFATKGRSDVETRFNPDTLAESWIDLLIKSSRRTATRLRPPRTRSYSRYRKVTNSEYTLLRSLQYEAISGLRLQGQTLDVGGGVVNSYWNLLRADSPIVSINVSPAVQPSALCDLNRGIPFKSESFDNVISFNTLEHIYNDRVVLAEIMRVLKANGTFHILVPFIYQQHASPHDHHRHPPEWWMKSLQDLGLAADAFCIEPLVWDRFSTACSFWGHGRKLVWLKRIALLKGMLRDLMWPLHIRPFNREAESDTKVAVGFYIKGRKRLTRSAT